MKDKEEFFDEEELVRQVLEENPVEERGTRDEWAQHVGWHHREDVHSLRSREHLIDTTSNITINSGRLGSSKAMIRDFTTVQFVFLLLIVFPVLVVIATKLRQSGKTRTV